MSLLAASSLGIGPIPSASALAVQRFSIRARVSTENPVAVRPVLRRLFPTGSVTLTGDPKELVLAGEAEGETARDLNRALLTELRRVERKTRLRAEWSVCGTTEKFFDYVPKGKRTKSG
jgi:hypothetical protein